MWTSNVKQMWFRGHWQVSCLGLLGSCSFAGAYIRKCRLSAGSPALLPCSFCWLVGNGMGELPSEMRHWNEVSRSQAAEESCQRTARPGLSWSAFYLLSKYWLSKYESYMFLAFANLIPSLFSHYCPILRSLLMCCFCLTVSTEDFSCEDGNVMPIHRASSVLSPLLHLVHGKCWKKSEIVLLLY